MPDSLMRPPASPQFPHKITVDNSPVHIPPGPLRSSTLVKAGLPKLYDPGYATTAAYTSSITYIDGLRGVLRHRGYPIADLVKTVSYDQVSYLLLFGELPTQRALFKWNKRLSIPDLPQSVARVITAFDTDSHPMPVLMAALSALGAAQPHLNPSIVGTSVYAKNDARMEAITLALGLFPTIIAGIHRHLTGESPAFVATHSAPLSYTEKFLFLMNARPANTKLANALDKILTLHADHEQNCSTATVRQLSSSGVDLFSSLSGGVAALYGPLHGGACEGVLKMLNRIKTVDRVSSFLQGVKRREEKLMGFGHRVYKNYDPRAQIVRRIAYEVFALVGKKDPLIDVATRLEQEALADDYFVQRKLYPNIDFYSGLIYRAMGIEPQFYPMLFALGRASGWVAHWYEFLDDPDRRIARPHQRYVGEIGPRKVTRIEERDDMPTAKL